jgi:hypothetical protein
MMLNRLQVERIRASNTASSEAATQTISFAADHQTESQLDEGVAPQFSRFC